MIALLLLLFSAETINFYIDPVVYRSTIQIKDTITQTTKKEDIFYMELNGSIPYHELTYETVDSTIITKAIISFKLVNLNHPDSLIDTLYRQFTIPSFEQAAKQQMSFIVQFGLHVPRGKFKYKINISSGNKKGSVENEIVIKKEDYKMSDILLANNIISDTTEDYLRKGNVKVIPHPSHQFNERYTNLYIYYEIYDLTPDTNQLAITYTIKDNNGILIGKIPRRIDKKYESQSVNFGFSIKDIVPGQYFLNVEVKDNNTQMVVQKETSFEIIRAVQEEVSYEGMPYYEEIEYFLTAEEYKYFKSLPKEGKRKYLGKFWDGYDYSEIAERFEYTDENFQEGSKVGHKTERGRIYIKYGEPDEREKSTIEIEESKPYEHWQYFNGYQFIFVDILGTYEYTLVWTNVRDERSQSTLYRYLPQSIRDQIE